MMALLLALAQAAVPPVQPAPRPSTEALDWARLPTFPWRVPPGYDAVTTRFVAGEVAAGRCRAAEDQRGRLLAVEVAVQVDPDGNVGTVRPRAIGCATIEQYTAGIVSRMARDNIDAAALQGPGWYRVVTTYTWRR